jgi:hypothetical protein
MLDPHWLFVVYNVARQLLSMQQGADGQRILGIAREPICDGLVALPADATASRSNSHVVSSASSRRVSVPVAAPQLLLWTCAPPLRACVAA